MKSVTVTLGGESYTIHELKARPNAEWRKRLQELLAEVTSLLENAPKLELTTESIVGLIQSAQRLVLSSPDRLRELLLAYAPELAAQQDRIEAEAYDSELLTAFVEVLKLAFPFGSLATVVSGALSKATSPSSPGPSGDSGTTK